MSLKWYHPLRADGTPQCLDVIQNVGTRKWYQNLYRACPPWVTRSMLAPIYAEAQRRRDRGERARVDHMVPLNHPMVCGLHVPANLRIVGHDLNTMKSNRWWPDMPNEQLHLFIHPEDIEQYRLI